MHKQKIIAKWLTIILLITIAIGSYALFHTLFGRSAFTPDNSAQAGDTAGGDQRPEPPHVPYYTTLPREAEILSGVSVAHTGGERDDTLEAAAAVGSRIYAFVSTSSTEYDVKKSGLYIAVFDNDALCYVNVFAPNDEHALEVKPTVTGVALVTKREDERSLYLFDYYGRLSASLELPPFDDCRLYLLDNVLRILYIENGALHTASLLNAAIEKSPFLYDCDAENISGVFARQNKLYCAVTDSKNTTSIISFEQYKGFKVEKSLLNFELRQIGNVSYDGKSSLILLGKSGGEYVLTTLSSSFETEAQISLKSETEPLFFTNGGEIFFVGGTSVKTLCRHLDVISEAELKESAGDAAGVYPLSSRMLFQTSKDGKFCLFELKGGVPVKLFETYSQTPITPIFTLSGLRAAFSTRQNEKTYRMNFGGSDVFCVGVSLP